MATQQVAEREELGTVTVDRYTDAGEVLGTIEVSSEIFGRSPNIPLMHQVVTAQLAARRSGTQSTKTRAEVAGGGAKPYRQKGTGRARQGTIRAPQFVGGGVALGPKPRSYAQRTPRKMTRLALFCALSDRVSEGRLCLVESWSFDVPKTKDAVKSLNALGLEGSILIVLGPDDTMAERSFANLQNVDLVDGSQLTAYDVLVNDWIVFTDETLPGEATAVADSDTAISARARFEAGDAADDEEDESSASASGETDASSDDSSSDDSSSDADTAAEADVADDAEADEDAPKVTAAKPSRAKRAPAAKKAAPAVEADADEEVVASADSEVAAEVDDEEVGVSSPTEDSVDVPEATDEATDDATDDEEDSE